MSALIYRFTLLDEETWEESEHELPGKHAVCKRCEGHGSHLNPAIGEHAYTREEFFEAFSDEDQQEQYFKRGGIYDVPCGECGSNRVVVVPDKRVLSPEQSALLARHRRAENERQRIDEIDRATMRRECGQW